MVFVFLAIIGFVLWNPWLHSMELRVFLSVVVAFVYVWGLVKYLVRPPGASPWRMSNLARVHTMVGTIDRCILVVKVKEPFVKWANSLSDSPATKESMREDSSAYLFPHFETEEEKEERLEECYETIFELELHGWWTLKKAWPKNRTFKMFKEWFDLEFHSMVVDLIEGEIEKQ